MQKKKKKKPRGVGGSEATGRIELIIIKKENWNRIGLLSLSRRKFLARKYMIRMVH